MNTHMHIMCTHVYVYAYTPLCMYICTCMYMLIRLDTYVKENIVRIVFLQIIVYAYMFIHIHLYTYVARWSQLRPNIHEERTYLVRVYTFT